MNKIDFIDKMRMFHSGDPITLVVRGNYGSYKHSGLLVKVERGRVYLDSGMAHSYRRIIRIHWGKETRK